MEDNKRYNILFVDDDHYLARMYPKIFKGTEYNVISLIDAFEALGILEVQSIDAIVSDYEMPEMDGVEFLRRVREKKPNIPRIMMSGNISRIPKETIDELNLYALVKKPFNNGELVKIIKGAIEISSLFPQ